MGQISKTKSDSVEKKQRLRHQDRQSRDPLTCFRVSGRLFCFGRGSDVSSMFWTSVVQVEQMNKNMGLMCIKHCPL